MSPDTASTTGLHDSRTGLRYSDLVERIGDKGSRAWDTDNRARQLMADGRDDIIILSVGDPDFNTPPPIVNAVMESLHHGGTHYSSMAGILPLREAIAARWLEAEGVCALPCDGFGPSGEGFLRISLSAPMETMEDACARLDRVARGPNR